MKLITLPHDQYQYDCQSWPEKAMAPYSSTLAWKSHGWRSLEGCSPWGHRGSDRTSLFTFHFHALEKEMATHCSVLAWRIPGTGEPGGLPSMGLHRIGHDWSDLAAVRADCSVSVCCPLPSPIKAIPHGLSVGQRGQPSVRSPSYPLVAGVWNKANFLHFPCGSTAMWETWIRSVGWEDPLEKGKATHSSILAWRIPWTM